jgi:hypothetical protein
MKLGTLTAIAALAMATTLGSAVTPADAGKKGRQAHQQGSKKVHIRLNKHESPDKAHVTTRNLEKLQRKLEGSSRHRATTNALGKEIHDRKSQRAMGQLLSVEDGASAIFSLGSVGEIVTRRRRGDH